MKIEINEKTKKILFGILAAVLIGAFVIMTVLNPGPDHIEDTNGADNYALEKITEQDVIDQKMGIKGGVGESETHYDFAGLNISEGIRYSSKKFTGVYRIYSATIFKGSDIYVSLAEFNIKEGNFAFYIVFDGEVVGQVKPSESGFSEFKMENIDKTGSLEYVIAGESASFEFISPTEF